MSQLVDQSQILDIELPDVPDPRSKTELCCAGHDVVTFEPARPGKHEVDLRVTLCDLPKGLHQSQVVLMREKLCRV